MESLSSESKSIALDVDASQILWIIKNEISPLKDAIRFFITELSK